MSINNNNINATVYTKEKNVNIRALPATTGDVLRVVPANSKAGVTDGVYFAMPDGNWYAIALPDKPNGKDFGYMREDLIRFEVTGNQNNNQPKKTLKDLLLFNKTQFNLPIRKEAAAGSDIIVNITANGHAGKATGNGRQLNNVLWIETSFLRSGVQTTGWIQYDNVEIKNPETINSDEVQAFIDDTIKYNKLINDELAKLTISIKLAKDQGLDTTKAEQYHKELSERLQDRNNKLANSQYLKDIVYAGKILRSDAVLAFTVPGVGINKFMNDLISFFKGDLKGIGVAIIDDLIIAGVLAVVVLGVGGIAAYLYFRGLSKEVHEDFEKTKTGPYQRLYNSLNNTQQKVLDDQQKVWENTTIKRETKAKVGVWSDIIFYGAIGLGAFFLINKFTSK